MRRHNFKFLVVLLVGYVLFANAGSACADEVSSLRLRLSWGHTTAAHRQFAIKLTTNDVTISGLQPFSLEEQDEWDGTLLQTSAGNGDVDGLDVTLSFPRREITPLAKPQAIWKYLLEHSDPDTARRLQQDPGFRPDSRRVSVELGADGIRGFSLTVDQLLRNPSFWFPELDLAVSTGDNPASFESIQGELRSWAGQRILDRTEADPEATYEEYLARWEDMGHPGYRNDSQVGPGHVICLAWDSSLHKFGVDRVGGVWNDYATTNSFQYGLDVAPGRDRIETWRSQQLLDGLPIVTTRFEDDGLSFELEQFVYPLEGPPSTRDGEVTVVLLQQLRTREIKGQAREFPIRIRHARRFGMNTGPWTPATQPDHALTWSSAGVPGVVSTWQGPEIQVQPGTPGSTVLTNDTVELIARIDSHGSRKWVAKVTYAPLTGPAVERLLALDYEDAKKKTIQFWSNYLSRGAQFIVPEEPVNTLYRANLWHALRLPRRHRGTESGVRIDLPYSNFAYDQRGTPWPVNQAIYVDYHVYDLRGYHDISAEELSAIFRNNQEPSGRVGGFANWGVYTPSMLYAVAQQFLLSGDRARLETLLPASLKAMDWCLAELKKAQPSRGAATGLVLAPLNDLSHEDRAWAFNQSYIFAGLQAFGQVLRETGHPRADECLKAAQNLGTAIELAFATAAIQSPAVQLRDHTWIPYVPADAMTPRRMPEIWYPTDVDTGAVHLPRLRALSPSGFLTHYLLHDHEDNLFLKGWGMANEPVYNQHAIAYLHQARPKAAIRAFYSMMACAFSHSTFEPVEHRWGWPQYFGPPSTDGAWFDLYRHMMIDERPDDSLWLLPAAPRRWFSDGKTIQIQSAPTYFGPLSATVNSLAEGREIRVNVDLKARRLPSSIHIHLRQANSLPLQSVELNGQNWTEFEAASGIVRLPSTKGGTYQIRARF